MGNVVAPAKIPKITKLKEIIQILVEQQRKIKWSRKQAWNAEKRLHAKLKNNVRKKNEKRWTDVGIDDEIREMAEEIAYQRHRISDLKVCIDTLRTLEYKVKSIMNAYFTHTTLQVVNNAIKKTNITAETLHQPQGVSFCHRNYLFNPNLLLVCEKLLTCADKPSGVQDLIDELLKTKMKM